MSAGLTNADLVKLMDALSAHPNVAKNITRVNLRFNGLTEIKLSNKLVNLEEIYLGGNKLTQFVIPRELNKIKDLQLSDNLFTSLALPEMPTLESLDIDGNQLTSFTLPRMQSLVGLNLAKNKLTDVDLSKSPSSLGYISLANNKLTKFQLPASYQPQGCSILLANNPLLIIDTPNLSHIPRQETGGLDTAPAIDLTGNKLTQAMQIILKKKFNQETIDGVLDMILAIEFHH